MSKKVTAFDTTESSGEMKNQGKSAGAKAWIIKPFGPDQLPDAVKKLFDA